MRFLRAVVVVLALLAPRAARAHPPVSIVRDSHGNVYYSDLTHVWRLAPSGEKSIVVHNVHSHELYLDASDNLFGEHLWYEGDATKKWGYRVWKRAPDGRITDVIPATEGFRAHYSFVRDAEGTMYFADGLERAAVIRKRTSAGAETVLSKGPFTDVRWLAATPDGNVYLIDDGRLVRIDRAGQIRELVHDLRDRSVTRALVDKRHSVMGLYPDGRGNVYVARYGTGEVLKVTSAGRITTVTTSTMPWSPSGVMVTPDGGLYVLEASVDNRVRVRLVKPT
ncbi:MAG: hypothetical protein V4550_13660 [Gemmatimonadota bacterium]